MRLYKTLFIIAYKWTFFSTQKAKIQTSNFLYFVSQSTYKVQPHGSKRHSRTCFLGLSYKLQCMQAQYMDPSLSQKLPQLCLGHCPTVPTPQQQKQPQCPISFSLHLPLEFHNYIYIYIYYLFCLLRENSMVYKGSPLYQSL